LAYDTQNSRINRWVPLQECCVLFFKLLEEGATHIGVATDHVIESLPQ
jgi:hypothetical protein